MKKLSSIIRLISSIIVTIILTYVFIKLEKYKIIIVPFLLCAITALGGEISLMLKKEKLAYYFKVAQDISFLTFWYGMVAFLTYLSIKEREISKIIFSIPFWFAGLLIIKPYLKKK